jgi:hypothetical protein
MQHAALPDKESEIAEVTFTRITSSTNCAIKQGEKKEEKTETKNLVRTFSEHRVCRAESSEGRAWIPMQ